MAIALLLNRTLVLLKLKCILLLSAGQIIALVCVYMQMYRVMAIALLLNRTLVLPKLKCFCYKNWFMSEQCRIPGDKVTKFPMDCALDQVSS